jgi:hypothetical protein
MYVDVDCGADDIDKQADPVNALAPQTPTSSFGMNVLAIRLSAFDAA